MINIEIHTQPDDETCGPTSLCSLYHYYGLPIELNEVISTVERSLSGGTLAPLLGKHALQMGFSATTYVSNVSLFDPTWFTHGLADPDLLISKLTEQIKYKVSPQIRQSSQAYIDFSKLGGTVCFKTVDEHLLQEYFEKNMPILTGLSATYLYRCARELFDEKGHGSFDDVRGSPCGHFVVLCGYDDAHRLVIVADPHRANPISNTNYYKVEVQRLINAIMLGVLTFDANLLIIQPRG